MNAVHANCFMKFCESLTSYASVMSANNFAGICKENGNIS